MLKLPAPTVDYHYSWKVGEGPQGTLVERYPDVDRTPVSVTRVTITEYPGDDPVEPVQVTECKGRVLTTTGKVDGRHTYEKSVWLHTGLADELLAAHKERVWDD